MGRAGQPARKWWDLWYAGAGRAGNRGPFCRGGPPEWTPGSNDGVKVNMCVFAVDFDSDGAGKCYWMTKSVPGTLHVAVGQKCSGETTSNKYRSLTFRNNFESGVAAEHDGWSAWYF